MKKCDNCGESNASLIAEGYTRPIPDAAPTYSEWEQLWLCRECEREINHYDENGRVRKVKMSIRNKNKRIEYGTPLSGDL